jgi:hypothetical protein
MIMTSEIVTSEIIVTRRSILVSLTYSKNRPESLTNSGRAIPNPSLAYCILCTFSDSVSSVNPARAATFIIILATDTPSQGVSTHKGSPLRYPNPSTGAFLPPYLLLTPHHIQNCKTAKDVSKSYDSLVDIFESIENFLKRFKIYTKSPPTPAMIDIITKIMAELITVLALATKQMKRGRLSMCLHLLTIA